MSSVFAVALRGGLEAPGSPGMRSPPTTRPSHRRVQDDVALLATELVTNAVHHGGAATDRPLQVKFRRQSTPAPSGTRVWFELPAGLTA
jgi:hypothetical protein